MRDRKVLAPGVWAVVGAVALSACDDSTTEPQDRIVEGVNLTELFAPPTSAEIDAVLADWSGRDPQASGVQIEVTRAVTVGTTAATVRVVSHIVDGFRHYGAVLVPDGAAAASLPVLMYTHGGDGGVDVDELLTLFPIFIAGFEDAFVLVAPSFRSEPLTLEATVFQSEGEPSPWDRDVDDALALLNAVLKDLAPEADSGRIGVIGFSRGACVGLLMAERDPRIDVVVEFFGPTDFFGPFVQEVTEDALRGNLRDLPGVDFLDATYLQPLKRGEITIDDVRSQILRRSPVYFVEALPSVQVHHGTDDETVPVGEALRLIEVMDGLGRGEPDFESYIYEGGTHNPLTLDGSIPRARAFLERLISTALVAE